MKLKEISKKSSENFVAWVSDVAKKSMSFYAVATRIVFLAFMNGGKER